MRGDSILEDLLSIDASDRNYSVQLPVWQKHGIQLCRALSMHEAMEMLQKREYIAIGINADSIDYVPLLGILREATTAPIHVIKSKYDVDEHTLALSLGADVFGVWAKDPEDNVKRGLALFLRYYNRLSHGADKPLVLVHGEVRLYAAHHRVFVGAREIQPRNKEYRLLTLFMENRGRLLAPEWLLSQVWGHAEYSVSHWQLWNQIKNLRAKLSPTPEDFNYIQTIKGYGYRFVTPADAR